MIIFNAFSSLFVTNIFQSIFVSNFRTSLYVKSGHSNNTRHFFPLFWTLTVIWVFCKTFRLWTLLIFTFKSSFKNQPKALVTFAPWPPKSVADYVNGPKLKCVSNIDHVLAKQIVKSRTVKPIYLYSCFGLRFILFIVVALNKFFYFANTKWHMSTVVRYWWPLTPFVNKQD